MRSSRDLDERSAKKLRVEWKSLFRLASEGTSIARLQFKQINQRDVIQSNPASNRHQITNLIIGWLSRGKSGGHMAYDADECAQALPVVDALKRASLRESLACEARH